MSSKNCIKCAKNKPLCDYYKHPMMADGHLGKCKECCKAAATKRRNEKIDEVRAYDRQRAKNPERIKAMTAQSRKWRAEDRRRSAAHNAVARAVKSGKLVPQPCERCGREDAMAHHESYDRPLDVVWLCQPDHKQRHKEMAIEGIER